MYDKDVYVLQEQLEALKLAINSSYDGIHIVDKHGRTVYINHAVERITGLNVESIGDKSIYQLEQEGCFSESVTVKVFEQKVPLTIMQKVTNGKEVLVTGTPVFINGAMEFVIVNSRDVTELSQLKREIIEKRLLAEKYHSELRKHTGDLICKSQEMNKVINTSLSISKVDSTVLITGESGTGKGVIARFIHDNSARKKNAFIKIDCSTIPESLFESEIFGYEKGTFTGADTNGKLGMVQLADKGTLFLDEIGEVPVTMQAKLLRLIQDKEIIKVGGKAPVPVDTRIIAATNRDLLKMVEKGLFREDLYYRLNVIPLCIPPLRERKEDIPLLVFNLCGRLNQKYGFNKKISIEATEKLIDYDWPGNVRELENMVERLMILSGNESIEAEDLPKEIRKGKPLSVSEDHTLKYMIEQFEKDVLRSLLSEKRTVSDISKMLQVDVTTIRRKLHKYGLVPNIHIG